MILENYQTSFDNGKVLQLLGAKQGKHVSPASLRRIDLMVEEIEGMLKPQLSFRILSISRKNKSRVHLSEGTCFKSSKLARALIPADSVCCFVATVGPAVDVEIQRLMQQNHFSNAYILDALGSMSAENIVEQFYRRMHESQIKKNGGVTLRFSPGYCDWPIHDQRPFFKLFAKTGTPDVILTDSCLMSPRKSVSGLFGLLPQKVSGTDPSYNPCRTCTKRNCIARRNH